MTRKRTNKKVKNKNTLKKTNLKYGLILLAILIIAAGSIIVLTSQDDEPPENQSQPGKWLFALDTSSAHVGSYEAYSTGYIPTLVIIDINGDIIHKKAGVHYENELLDLIQQAQNPSDTLGPAPDFTLETLNGETFKLSEHQEKVVILDIMAVRCPPCKMQMPELHKAKLEKGDDIVILSIDADAAYGYETENDVREAFGEYIKE
jgi:peroxiredoxin